MICEEWLTNLGPAVPVGDLPVGTTLYHAERAPENGRAGIKTESATGDPPGTSRVTYFGTGRSEYQPNGTPVIEVEYRAVLAS